MDSIASDAPAHAAAPPRDRRGFLKVVGAVGALAAVPKRARAAGESGLEALALASVDELGVGDVIDFGFPRDEDQAFLTRLGRPAVGGVGDDQDIVAYQRACPHMGCYISELNIEAGVLGPCGCHRSRFDLANDGQQIVGRATQNLVRVELEIIDGTIYAIGFVGLPYGYPLEE